MKITIVQKSTDYIAGAEENDYTLWQISMTKEKFDEIFKEYQDEGVSVRGTKEQILEELSSDII